MHLFGLQSGDINAWTYLLRSSADLIHVVVSDVNRYPEHEELTRFEVHLAKQSDPIQFWLVQTDTAEATFYQSFQSELKPLLPTCWLAEVDPNGIGWLVLSGVDLLDRDRRRRWRVSHAVEAIEGLAEMHARYWGIQLRDDLWLQPLLAIEGETAEQAQGPAPLTRRTQRQTPFSSPYAEPASVQFKNYFRPVRQSLQQARTRVPHIVTEPVFEAAAQLIRQPGLILNPLLSLPQTLVHGSPNHTNWRFDVLGGRTLLNWHTVALGPAVIDLVRFIHGEREIEYDVAQGEFLEPDKRTETLLDSYFIALFRGLIERHGYEVRYSSRYMRRYALPAAQCFLFLDTVLPSLNRTTDQSGLEGETATAAFLDAFRLLTLSA